MRSFPLLSLLLLTTACAFEFEVNSQRTSLENQVLGSYKEIEDDLVLVSSVRAGGAKATAQLSPDKKRAVDARMNQDFNRDDIDELKDKGVLGEANDGRVAFLPSGLQSGKATGKDLSLARQLLDEENRDRAEIWKRIIAANENLSEKDLPEVRKTYAKLQQDSAAPGHYVQTPSGSWEKRPGA